MKFKDAVVANAKKQIEERKKEQEKDFRERYDKKRVYKFPPENEINMVKHFYFPKFIVLNKLKRFLAFDMTKAALAVYPVLCSWADFEKDEWFHCSRENISTMAGITINTVEKGIENLILNSLLERKKVTEGKRHFWLYRITFIRKGSIEKNKGDFFIFYTCIIHSGVWAKLTPRAKSLYLAMRSTAKLDFKIYCEIEEQVPFDNQLGYEEFYQMRKWDLCDSSLSELARLVNITSINIQNTIKQLEQYKLIEKIDQWIKVYLRPRTMKSGKIG